MKSYPGSYWGREGFRIGVIVEEDEGPYKDGGDGETYISSSKEQLKS